MLCSNGDMRFLMKRNFPGRAQRNISHKASITLMATVKHVAEKRRTSCQMLNKQENGYW